MTDAEQTKAIEQQLRAALDDDAVTDVASPDQLATQADLIKQIMDATYRLALMVEQSALTLSRIRNLVNTLEDARRRRDA